MNIWQKIFSKITFKDYPDVSTPLNATNLNVMTNAIDGLDDRVVESRNDIVKILGNMATEYDETSTYDVGSYVIHDGLLYKCIVAVEAGEAFNVDKWEKTDCGVEFEKINSQVDELNSNLTNNTTDINTLKNKWVKSGVINRSNVDVVLQNNCFYIVTLAPSTSVCLLYLVWVYGNSIGYARLSGTENTTSGSRLQIITTGTTLGIYAQNTIAVYSVFQLK